MLRRLYRHVFSIQNQRCPSILWEKSSACQLGAVESGLPSVFARSIQFSHFCTDKSRKFGDKLSFSVDNELNSDIVYDPKAYEFRKIFDCDIAEASKLYKILSAQHSDHINMKPIKKIVNWLRRIGTTSPVIIKNWHILLISIDELKKRNIRLSRSQWIQTDDYMPFLAVDEEKIKHIQLHQGHVIRNRLYLLKEYMPAIEPHVVSYYCSRNLYIFEMGLELLERKLKMLLSHNVLPENILRDLDVLARAERKIKQRLEFLEKCRVKLIKPWMLKCKEGVLTRSIELRLSRNPEQNEIVELLAERLDLHWTTATCLYNKNKFLRDLDCETVHELIDELLNIFSLADIKANISLLKQSLMEIKIRVAELNALEKSFISPKVLKLSSKEFKQYLDDVKNT